MDEDTRRRRVSMPGDLHSCGGRGNTGLSRMPSFDRRELPGSAWPIGWLLFAIVMAAILPLGAYISNILVQQASDADEEARALALSTASAAAAWTREKLRSAETL